MKLFVLILSIIAVVLSVAWFIAQPGYEPAITFLGGIAGIVGSRLNRSRKQQTDTTTSIHLRPQRLSARNALLAFSEFCLKYRTLHPKKYPNRTQDLMSEIDGFKSTIELLGPLAMPEFDSIQKEVVAHAWNLQRLLDRQDGIDQRPINSKYQTIDDNLDGVINWFVDVKTRIKMQIDPYLEVETPTKHSSGRRKAGAA